MSGAVGAILLQDASDGSHTLYLRNSPGWRTF